MSAAASPRQYISVRAGAWRIETELPVRAPPAAIIFEAGDVLRPGRRKPRGVGHVIARPSVPHDPPRHHFVDPASPAPAPPPAAPAPQAFTDRLAKGDREHGIMVHNARLVANKELNQTAFEHDDPWGRRQSRGNLGYSNVKSKGWR